MDRRQFHRSCIAAVAALPSSGQLLVGQSPETENVSPVSEDLNAGTARGPWRRLFLDGAAVEQSDHLRRVFHAAEKFSDRPVLERDQPWEGVSAITGPYVYGTVLQEEGKFRMWYQLLHEGNHVGYAESQDGVHWTKPALGIIEFKGSRANNLVVSAFDPAAAGGGHCHNPSVIRRVNAPEAETRYMLFGFDGHQGHARAAFSSDGLHWRYDPATEKQPLFRSSDVVNFDYDPYEGRFYSTWKTRNRRGRAVGIAWSSDGTNWTKPFDGPVFAADDLDPDTTQIYGMPVFPYQGLYVGLPWIYHARYFRYGDYSVERLHEAQHDSPRTMDVQLAWSWDLINWTRPLSREPFLNRGKPGTWDAGMVVTARAPVAVNDRLYFYYGGTDGVHDERRVCAAIGLATLRLDGFCSMKAESQVGSLVTRREPFHEPAVLINARTTSAGSITAEILDRHDQLVTGFSREECIAFQGDAVRHVLRWKTSQFSPEPRRPDYKIRFWLQDAELFSYLPQGLDSSQRDLTRFPLQGP